jgi:hypothetical protein
VPSRDATRDLCVLARWTPLTTAAARAAGAEIMWEDIDALHSGSHVVGASPRPRRAANTANSRGGSNRSSRVAVRLRVARAWGETTSMVPGLELLEPGRALCAQRASDQAVARRPSVLRLIGSASS